VILASGLKYVGLSTTALGWTLCGVLLAAASAWLVRTRAWRRPAPTAPPAADGQARAEQPGSPLDVARA
jgi:hypothetical protein